MFEYLKKVSIILGHTICIFILLYSYATTRFETQKEESLTTEKEQVITVIKPEKQVANLSPTFVSTEIQINKPTATVESAITAAPIPTVVEEEEREEVKNKVLQNITDGVYTVLDNQSDKWWFRRKENHVPSGSGESFSIAEYQGFYLNKQTSEEDKVLYLTIDCGFGSRNTAVILDVFKEQGIKATFFVTGYFLKECPQYVRRMIEEGHTVANHSATHSVLTGLTDAEIYEEIISCEELFYEITGTQMALYFRPPEGAYSQRTMQITEDLGYKTIFWSLAYYDYNVNDQPGAEFVLDHFENYCHNGAIPLMHNDSDSNMEAMDSVITFLKEQGYRFGTLDELE